MKSFFRRLFNKMGITPVNITDKIDDSLLAVAEYFMAMLAAVESMLRAPTTKLPLQIDFWLLPKAMKSDASVCQN